MSDGVGDVVLGRARDAAAHGGWVEAYDLFMAADADGLIGAAELPELASVAYAAGHLDVTIEAWERCHALCAQAGDRIMGAGAAVRVAMHLLFDTALMGPVRGWLLRAERLLEGTEDTPVHAWHAVIRTYERMLSGDLEHAKQWAARAVDVGARRDPAAHAIGLVATARLLILEGEVERGLALLDDAGAATMSGELDPMSTGVVYCELVCALQGLAQYDVAEEWTEAMERWSRTSAIGSLHGRCRVHRAEILRLRGDCEAAELEVSEACAELRPYLRREMGWPLTELGRIRMVRGDLDGAEHAFLAAHRLGWDAQPGLALLHLARGETDVAAASIRDALDHPMLVPSKERPPNNDLQRAPLLEAQIEIAAAAGDVEGARSAFEELQRTAERFQSKALGASAALSKGRVQLLDGDAEPAAQSFAESVRRWSELGAPYEAARARIGLAGALRAAGRDRQADIEHRAAVALLEPAEPQPSNLGKAVAGTVSADANVFRREGDVWLVAFEGHEARIRDLKGMRYLARLLDEPGREFHVLDLVAAEAGGRAPDDAGDAGELLDDRAKEAYRRRLAEIDEDLEQARASNDLARETQSDLEREFLLRELSRAVGLGGRDRRAGSASERARAGVTRALRHAIARVAENLPPLDEHLNRTVRTGTYCSYQPDQRAPARWTS